MMDFKVKFITLFISLLWLFTTSTYAALNGNSCKGSKLTPADGTQNPNGDCVSTILGELPTKNNMISTLILSPDNGQTIQANTQFQVVTKTNNLNAGFFSNPATTYYTIPQQLGANGLINGHSHVTIQQIDGKNPPDATKFAFFQGLNNGTDNKGELSVNVANGLPPGQYRICTMVSSESHQCVTMPVAQRGAQDDCIRINVAGGNNNNGKANNGKANNGKANNGKANNGKANNGKANNGKANNGGNQANNGKANNGGNQANNGKANNGKANNAGNQGNAGKGGNQGQGANGGNQGQGANGGNQGKGARKAKGKKAAQPAKGKGKGKKRMF